MASAPSPASSRSLFLVLVEKELRELFQSPRFAVTFAVVAVLVLLAFGLGGASHLQARSEHDAARSEAQRQLAGQTDWARVEPRIRRPPAPLESLVSGVGHDVGRHALIRPGAPVEASSSLYGDRPLLAMWRFLDLEFVFGVVLSLFAVLFAFDAVSGEKERGTLRLALSNAVPRHVYVLGKMTGAFLGLAVPLLLPILGGCLLLLAEGVPMEGDDWIRLAGVVAAGYLYLACFLGLALFVSARTHRASSSFLVLLVLWIGLVLVVPRAAVLAAGRWVEVPSVDEAISQRSRLASQLFKEDREALEKLMGAREGELRVEIAADDAAGAAAAVARFQGEINRFLEQRATERRERLDRLESERQEARRNLDERRRDLAFGLARLSPSALFSLAAVDLAGTGLELPRRFLEQARGYRNDYERFVRDKTGSSGGGMRIIVRTRDSAPEQATPIDPAEQPVFRFRPASLAESLAAAAGELGLLAAFALLAFAAAFVSFLRYDVR